MNDSFQPRILLLQRALQDSKPVYWECPGGCVDGNGNILKDALGREVFEEIGLQLSQIVHFFLYINGQPSETRRDLIGLAIHILLRCLSRN